jgi:hypothetical protein
MLFQDCGILFSRAGHALLTVVKNVDIAGVARGVLVQGYAACHITLGVPLGSE